MDPLSMPMPDAAPEPDADESALSDALEQIRALLDQIEATQVKGALEKKPDDAAPPPEVP